MYDLINVLSGKITFDCKAFQIADVASRVTKAGIKILYTNPNTFCWLLHVFQRIHERRQQLLLLHMCEIMRASIFNILIHIGLMNPMLMVI